MKVLTLERISLSENRFLFVFVCFFCPVHHLPILDIAFSPENTIRKSAYFVAPKVLRTYNTLGLLGLSVFFELLRLRILYAAHN